MNFKLNFSSSLFGGSDQATAESFETKRDNVLRKHGGELTSALRTAAVLLMTDLHKLDQLLDDQKLGDKVLLKDTRHTFKYLCAGYSNEEAGEDPRIVEVFNFFDNITRMAAEVMTNRQGPVSHALHTFGYKVVPTDHQTGSVLVGRNFRIVFG